MSATYAHAHSGSFITGSPKAGEDMHAYADEFDALFSEALAQALNYARTDLRQQASMNTEWKQYANLLDVEFDGTDFVYVMTGTDEQNQAMRDLEFGDQQARPNSLLRKAAMQHPVAISKMMTDFLSGAVPVA